MLNPSVHHPKKKTGVSLSVYCPCQTTSWWPWLLSRVLDDPQVKKPHGTYRLCLKWTNKEEEKWCLWTSQLCGVLIITSVNSHLSRILPIVSYTGDSPCLVKSNFMSPWVSCPPSTSYLMLFKSVAYHLHNVTNKSRCCWLLVIFFANDALRRLRKLSKWFNGSQVALILCRRRFAFQSACGFNLWNWSAGLVKPRSLFFPTTLPTLSWVLTIIYDTGVHPCHNASVS